MRIETKGGAARYRGGWSNVGVPATAIMVAFVAIANCHVNSTASNRIAALERNINGAATARSAQVTAAVPVAYRALVERIDFLERDLQACHSRWDVTMSAVEDAWPAARERALPERPWPPPMLSLPADFCLVVAALPDAKALGACIPVRSPPTVPRLPTAAIPPAEAGAGGGGAH